MFFIPGILIAIVTFPGVIVHELAHQIFCCLMKVPVLEVKYFQFENPCGYVVHESTDKPFANFIISTGPFFINTILGIIIVFPGMFLIHTFGLGSDLSSQIIWLVSIWLGISILAHAFPSIGDANNMVESILKNSDINIFIKILTAPIIGLIYIGSIGSVIWLDFVYAVAVGSLVPLLVLRLL